jgi:uncharacterized repeat protein (TIGR03803 family)
MSAGRALRADGIAPLGAMLQGHDGNLYGTTFEGGANNLGSVYKLSAGGAQVLLHSFAGSDGAHPSAGLIQGRDHNLYGSTAYGGASGNGGLFKITPQGALTPLYSFVGAPDGANPHAGLIQSTDGNFYGTATYGGAHATGTLFKITAAGTLTVIHSFSALDANGANSDGAYPYAGLIQGKDGNLYGAATSGGPGGNGTLFKITRSGKLTLLHFFQADQGGTNGDGANPYGTLVQATDGNFYGDAASGGSYGFGTIFRLTPQGQFTTLYSFNGAANFDGENPIGGLIQGKDGNLYGTTEGGNDGTTLDSTIGGDIWATVFKMTPSGTLTTLYSFYGAANPYAGLIQATDGDFYGTAFKGGAYGCGEVFKVDPSGNLTPLYAFGGNGDGGAPRGRLVRGSDGSLYGTTDTGGVYGYGSVFRTTTAGAVTVLYAFTAQADGGGPGGLTLGRDGAFYGATSYGGNGTGALYKITPEGGLTVLYTFSATSGYPKYANSDGAYPSAALIQATDGQFYGTTRSGGANGAGTVFRITSKGVLTTLHSFSALSNGSYGTNSDGATPRSTLVQARDGGLYGATYAGGANGNGVVFKITTLGALTVVYTFSATDGQGFNADGTSPIGGLTLDKTGNFYGVTYSGGANGTGVVYKLTPGGTLTTLYSFGAWNGYWLPNSDGAFPATDLLEGKDGNLYGTTAFGGQEGFGTLFKITQAGQLTTLYSFSALGDLPIGANNDGATPQSALMQNTNGALYGATYEGGSYGWGTLFQITTKGAFTTLHAFSH